MPIPTHGPYCRTYAQPTTCKFCKEQVWFFACNCGSMVFFEQLGAPWLQHFCEAREIKQLIDELTRMTNMNSEAIFCLIEKRERESGKSMTQEMRDVIEGYIGVRYYPPTIQRVAPSRDIVDVCGIVVSVNRNINLFKKFGYENNIIGKSFLGKLAEHTFNEVILRDQPDRNNCRREYSLLINQNHQKMNEIKQNKFLFGDLNHIRHGKGIEFVLTDFNVAADTVNK